MKYVSYVLSAFAFLVFCYSFFFAKEEILMKQAVLWFYTALFALLLPEIKHLRYGDIEIDLKQEIREVKGIADLTKQRISDFLQGAIYSFV